MVIDGAGHGVPGSLITILVKAIETQIMSDIHNKILKPSPADILSYFNVSIKLMLKQSKGSKSNAGFDGGVLYYNRQTNKCKYAGAKTPLYIIKDNKLEVIKSDRKNVGFVRTKMEQVYTEYDIHIDKGTQIYICTDGIIDQEGKNDARFGKAEFERSILKYSHLPMKIQGEKLLSQFNEFQSDFEQSDDITFIGLKF